MEGGIPQASSQVLPLPAPPSPPAKTCMDEDDNSHITLDHTVSSPSSFSAAEGEGEGGDLTLISMEEGRLLYRRLKKQATAAAPGGGERRWRSFLIASVVSILLLPCLALSAYAIGIRIISAPRVEVSGVRLMGLPNDNNHIKAQVHFDGLLISSVRFPTLVHDGHVNLYYRSQEELEAYIGQFSVIKGHVSPHGSLEQHVNFTTIAFDQMRHNAGHELMTSYLSHKPSPMVIKGTVPIDLVLAGRIPVKVYIRCDLQVDWASSSVHSDCHNKILPLWAQDRW